ncbi:MAG: response regulator transcription factor [bacterium]
MVKKSRKKMIVIVDDDPDILLTLRLALQKEGYGVETAESVAELLEGFPSVKPDLILLDVMLPWMSGYDICYTLKNQFNDCPVIMISALGQRADIERGFWCGADEYFTKPLDLDVLLEKISELTAESSAA